MNFDTYFLLDKLRLVAFAKFYESFTELDKLLVLLSFNIVSSSKKRLTNILKINKLVLTFLGGSCV